MACCLVAACIHARLQKGLDGLLFGSCMYCQRTGTTVAIWAQGSIIKCSTYHGHSGVHHHGIHLRANQ